MKLMSVTIVGILSFFSHTAAADDVYWLKNSKIEYVVKHLLHTVEGVSTGAKGKVTCKEKKCEFLIAAPIKSFDSGSSNRDQHMLDVTKAALHPMVKIEGSFLFGGKSGLVDLDGALDFAGIKRKLARSKFEVSAQGQAIHVTGHFPVKMTEFEIERPALLGVAVDDNIEIHFDGTWEKS